jgi:regulatory protein
MAENELYRIALNKAMSQCSVRELCQDDIRSKLMLWGIEKNDNEKIIEILVRENFINESRYATAFARDKFKYNKWGKLKISAHLKIKKIKGDIIREALDSIDDEQYTNMIKLLLDSHRKTVKAKNQYELKAKLMRYGLSKGFESGLLYEMLGDLGE